MIAHHSKKKKICFDWDLNIVVGKGDSQTKSFNIDIMHLNNIQNDDPASIKKKNNLSSNGIKYKSEQNKPMQDPSQKIIKVQKIQK